MKFEWDKNKRQSNLRKHGIDFQEAYEIFNNPMLRRIDDRFEYGEDRWAALGMTHKCVVVVVYTELDGETINIISIRKATKNERKAYEKYLANRLG